MTEKVKTNNKRKIICRFESENDLKEFNDRNQTNILFNTTYYDLDTNERKEKKISNKSITPKIEYWKQEWLDMPEYISEKQSVYCKVDFYFDKTKWNNDDLKKIFNQNITSKTKSIWFPKLIQGKHSHLRVVGGDSNTKYPVYVVSKGRSENCTTSKYLSLMEVKHYVVVEPSDYEKYKEKVENEYATVILLDMSYKDSYDTFDDLGDMKSKGPGAARNFCWDHSIKNGHKWHWVMDDNANEGFFYMYKNMKLKCRSGEIFKATEDFVDRYTNIAIAGLNYSKFCKESDKTPAFVMNTRIYSFLLIRNDIPYRWRGRYNEDTDLSLRVLKDGWCTIQFNAFLAGKVTTQRVKGGNTDEFYAKEGTYPKSKMLEDMHPDVAKVVWKFNRWHHQVDYSGFKQKLIRKDDLILSKEPNDYNMIIIETNETTTNDSKLYLENKYLHNKCDCIA